MSAVIKIYRSESSGEHYSTLGPDGDVGALYLKAWDLDAYDGYPSAWADMTADIAEAHHFPSKLHAMEVWRQQSKRVPYRPDGQPNRPLTAYTVEIIEV
jgi:hypothetical protein